MLLLHTGDLFRTPFFLLLMTLSALAHVGALPGRKPRQSPPSITIAPRLADARRRRYGCGYARQYQNCSSVIARNCWPDDARAKRQKLCPHPAAFRGAVAFAGACVRAKCFTAVEHLATKTRFVADLRRDKKAHPWAFNQWKHLLNLFSLRLSASKKDCGRNGKYSTSIKRMRIAGLSYSL